MKQIKNRFVPPLRALLLTFGILNLLLGAADYLIEDTISLRFDEPLPQSHLISIEAKEDILAVSTDSHTRYSAQLFHVLPLKSVSVRQYGDIRLCPGGMPFGTKMFTEGLIVVGFTEVDTLTGSRQPAADAGIRERDILLKLNGDPITSAEDMVEKIGHGTGEPITLTVRRNEETLTITVLPSYSESEKQYKSGMWVRDNTAGIGTITYIDPASGAFGGLGHGVCDSATGALLPLSRGIIVDVTVHGIRKGAPGVPGELQGYFSSGKRGVLVGNSSAGVFGVLSPLPEGVGAEQALPIALKQEIRDGDAMIYCTLDESGVQGYTVHLRKIKNAPDNKNMEIIVTDPALIEKTGGIVQGMSGSPIIQNGKLVGAVTHVLVNDPTRGYGIYMENMLDAAE